MKKKNAICEWKYQLARLSVVDISMDRWRSTVEEDVNSADSPTRFSTTVEIDNNNNGAIKSSNDNNNKKKERKKGKTFE